MTMMTKERYERTNKRIKKSCLIIFAWLILLVAVDGFIAPYMVKYPNDLVVIGGALLAVFATAFSLSGLARVFFNYFNEQNRDENSY